MLEMQVAILTKMVTAVIEDFDESTPYIEAENDLFALKKMEMEEKFKRMTK